MVLAADASTLGQRFTLLVISVVYRGCGIPEEKENSRSYQKKAVVNLTLLKLLENLQDGVPDDWWVIVTTDRGLYAPVVV